MPDLNISKIKLLNVPLERDYKHTLYFDSLELQQTYFNTRVIKTFDDFTYIKKESAFVIDMPYDSAISCNYVAYQNIEKSNKWFYAFISDYEFRSDETTKITIETDVMQTYMFDYQVLPSFIDREHVTDDTRGLHTLPENLETGEYTCNSAVHNKALKYRGYVVGSTVDLYDTDSSAGQKPYSAISGTLYNGVFSGVAYFYFANYTELTAKLMELAEAGKSDAIVSIFMVPSLFIETVARDDNKGIFVKPTDKAYFREWKAQLGETDSDLLPEVPMSVNGYTPNNNKLFTFPYCYLMASNNSGGANIYHWEKFSQTHVEGVEGTVPYVDFAIVSAVTPGMSIRLIPRWYNNVKDGLTAQTIQDYNNEEGLNLGKFPICAWANDVYTNWLTQNSLNIGLTLGTAAAGAALGIATGGTGLLAAGAAVGGVGAIAGQLAQVHQQSFQSPTAQGNLNSGDVSFSSGLLTFSLYNMSIKQEYAKIIDKYFDMFGYKCNQVKRPNTNHRKYWWYTKTIDVNIKGNVPQKDMEIIKNCYNNGITFWRNTMDSKIKEYNGTNSIINQEE